MIERYILNKTLGAAFAASIVLGLSQVSWAGMSAAQRAAILAPTDDFSRAERWEALPGGGATNRKRLDREAFSQPSANLPFKARADFFVGNGLFRRIWVTAPASTQAADGLGPIYNARACQRCHLKDGRGHPPADAEDSAVSMFLRVSVPPANDAQRELLAELKAAVIPEPVYGSQIQDIANPGHPPEGRMVIAYADVPVKLADDETVILRKPTYALADLGYGPLHPDAMFSPRVAQPMIGLGLLEAVAAEDILAAADPDDANNDGISGKANRVWSVAAGKPMLGRFGWKAGKPSLAEQNAAAMAGDIGISNPLAPFAAGDCTEAQDKCRSAPNGNSPQYDDLEASAEVMDLILFYVRHVAVPERRDVDDVTVLRGKSLFYGAGCTGCHTPKFATRRKGVDPRLAGQLIWPYSDMLLHDMGDGLADNRPEGLATGREWRTQPLWGIGLTHKVSGHTQFLHDGRARNLTEAILWHGGEAQASRDAFAAMPKADRDALLAFLNSL